MKAAIFITMLVIGLTTIIGFAVPVFAQESCPVNDATRTIEEAQKILNQGNQAAFGSALACVMLTLAETRAELEGLRAGRLAFTGQIHIPKGWTITKPPASEAD